MLAVATAEGRSREQAWRARKDGSRFWAEVTVTALRGPAGELRGFAHVTRDLTGPLQRERELREESLRMADASRRKDELLGMLGHELRNPLSPIRNSLHLLRRGLDDPRFVSELYEVMDRQVDRLTRIVNDVLEVSRLARGLVALEPEPMDLCRLGRLAVEARCADAARAGLTLAAVAAPRAGLRAGGRGAAPSGRGRPAGERPEVHRPRRLGHARGRGRRRRRPGGAGRPGHGRGHRARGLAPDARGARPAGRVPRRRQGGPGPGPRADPGDRRPAWRHGPGAERRHGPRGRVRRPLAAVRAGPGGDSRPHRTTA